MSDLDPEPSIVIGVPGNWKDRSEIVASIAKNSGGYLFAGKILMHAESGVHFELEVYDRDPSLGAKVRSGGMGQIPEEELVAVEDHTFTLYLLSNETGREVVESMVDAVVGLLDAGGLVAKIEFAGFSIGSEKWREFAETKAAYYLYRSMVTLVGEGNDHFTCGMRAFGLPDCGMQGVELQTAFDLATEFCCYLMDESPRLASGHTFGTSSGSQKFRLSFDVYEHYPAGDSFHNPFGLWNLTPVDHG